VRILRARKGEEDGVLLRRSWERREETGMIFSLGEGWEREGRKGRGKEEGRDFSVSLVFEESSMLSFPILLATIMKKKHS